MKLIKGVFGLLWKIYLLIVVIITILVLYPFYLVILKREKYFQTGFRFLRFQAKVILFMGGFRVKVHGKVPYDEYESYIICPNHTSYLDILMLYVALPKYFVFLGKKELGDIPVFNIYFKRMNILVDRKNAKAAYKSIAKAYEVMEKGSSVVIFPEGTISDTAPELGPFKNGAFHLAQQLELPILPITFVGNHKLLEDKMSFFANCRPGRSHMYIHKPIVIDKDNPQGLLTLREQTRAAIESKL